jgi:hypothetical protein
MVRRRGSAVSNHEAPLWPQSFEPCYALLWMRAQSYQDSAENTESPLLALGCDQLTGSVR